jgi:hypothetical protein
MKRFDDVLRMLSSILLGIMVKDIDLMSKNLGTFCHCDATGQDQHPVAFYAVVMLLAVFLRNIHGSVRYDGYAQENHCSSRIEQHLAGRVYVWLLSICALFLGPSLAGRRLAHGFGPGDSAVLLGLVLFFPFVVYVVWDFTLWFAPIEERVVATGQVKRHLEGVVRNWVKIDAMGILLVMVFVAYWLFVERLGEEFLRVCAASGFIVVAGAMVVADYYTNRHFYFPPRQ